MQYDILYCCTVLYFGVITILQILDPFCQNDSDRADFPFHAVLYYGIFGVQILDKVGSKLTHVNLIIPEKN